MTDGARVGWRHVGILLALLCLPLVVAAVGLREPRWYPVLDLTMTELRVRDVGTSDTPLIGLPGRIGTIQEQGSHPGPVSFYALAPVYRALGSSAWALQVATLALQAAALATCLVLARRRGGRRAVLGVASLLAVLSAAYGFQVLTEPWNPYLPLLWWVAFLLAAWGVLDGDWRLLPVAVVAASFCAQTHLPYLGLCGALGVGVVAVALWGRRRAGQGWPPRGPVVLALGLAAVLWAPLVVDQVAHDPGNLTLLQEHLLDPPEESVGIRTGAHVMLVHLDLSQLLGGRRGLTGGLVDTTYDPLGSIVPGAVLLGAWALSAALTWRAGPPRLRRLNGLLLAALLLGAFSAGSIFGKLWFYLTLWAWVLGPLMAGAVIWAILDRVERRPASPRRFDPVLGAMGVLLVASVVVSTAEALDVPPPAEPLSRTLSLVVPPMLDAIDEGLGAATGRDGTYVVTWSDAMHFGSQGYSLVSELERAGFHAGFMPFAAVPGTTHRVIAPGTATAELHLASGPFIDEYAAERPEAVVLAEADPRTAAERAEYARLRQDLIRGLDEAGLSDLVTWADRNVFGVAIDTRLPVDLRRKAERMLDLGLPVAVFVVPG